MNGLNYLSENITSMRSLKLTIFYIVLKSKSLDNNVSNDLHVSENSLTTSVYIYSSIQDAKEWKRVEIGSQFSQCQSTGNAC